MPPAVPVATYRVQLNAKFGFADAAALVPYLQSLGVTQDFRFIVEQKGMFSFSGLSLDAVRRLRSEDGIYIVDSGRICVAALNERNLGYVCEAIARVL